MSLSRDSRAERKLKLYMRSAHRLKQGMERIDYEEDVILPMLEAIKSGKSAMPELPAGSSFDFQVEHVQVQDGSQAADPSPADNATRSEN
jgi:hypothetical protein